MKYYDDSFLAQKVMFVHRQLAKQQFPYHIELEWNEDAHILKQRWLDGKSADYRKFHDQRQALQALQALHETNRTIDWQCYKMLPKYDLQQKWQRRFHRFIDNAAPLKRLLATSYQEIVDEAERALTEIEQLRKTNEARTLLHGDVVHHNIMISPNAIKLVDFDLAALGEASDEVILWLHRVLAQTNYDVTILMHKHPYLQTARHKFGYLNYPNELMRESLFYLKLNERQQQVCYPFIQSLVREWQLHRQALKSTIQTMTQ